MGSEVTRPARMEACNISGFMSYGIRCKQVDTAGVSPLFVAQIIGDSGTRILNTYVSAIDEVLGS